MKKKIIISLLLVSAIGIGISSVKALTHERKITKLTELTNKQTNEIVSKNDINSQVNTSLVVEDQSNQILTNTNHQPNCNVAETHDHTGSNFNNHEQNHNSRHR